MAWFKRVRWSAWLLALLIPGLGVLLHQFKVGVPLTNASHDWLFAFRGNIPVTNAVVVFMDEASHEILGQPTRAAWDRRVHARLLDRLTRAGARVVVLDIVFNELSHSLTNKDEDRVFAEALKRNGRVILAADAKEPTDSRVTEPDVIPPHDLFRDATEDRWGLDQMKPSYDQVIRSHPPSFSQDKVSLSWRTARYLQAPITLRDNQETVERWMNYYGPAYHLPRCSFAEALDPEKTPDAFFRDRVVFVGASTLTKFSGERKDAYVTPFSKWVQDPRQLFIAGVEIQAVATLNLLRGDSLSRVAPRKELAGIVIFGLVAGLVLAGLRPTLATTVSLGLALAAGLGAYGLFTRQLLLVPWLILEVQLLVAWLCSIALNSIQLYVENRLFVRSLEMYLSPKLVKKFAADPDRKLLKPHAERQKLTIFFSDIEKFTTLTEGMDSDELCLMMNEYFQGAVGQCVHPTDGTVVKYIGDAIFAFWNAPELQVDHAARACDAALRFRVLSKLPVRGRLLVTRIGLHTGVANVGNFGSETRVDYTALGENINLASRMEGLNKYLGTDVLITGDVKKEIGDRFTTRHLGRFQLKGFERSVEVYELTGSREQPGVESFHESFDQALRLFQQRDLAAAENAFARVQESAPTDGPTRFYLKHLEEIRGCELPAEWAGEVELKEK